MVIRFFKSRQPLVNVILIIASMVIWGINYARFTVDSNIAAPFYNLLLVTITPDHKFIYFLIELALVASQALHINFICNKHEVLYKGSNLPGMFYLLLACSIPHFISFHPVLIVNTILFFTVHKIFRLYKNDSPLAWDFDSCVLLSIATLFYLPAAIFVLLYIAGLIILRPFSWRDWVVGGMGFLTPVFFVVLYYFLTDRLIEIQNLANTVALNKNFKIQNVVPDGYPLLIIWVTVLFVLSLLKLRTNFLKNTAKTRSYQLIFLFFTGISLLMILISHTEFLFRFSILCIPLAVVISYYFLTAKKIWLTESLIYLLIFFITLNYISIK